MRQFGPVSQGGIFAKFSGKQRARRRSRRCEPTARRHSLGGRHVDVVATGRVHAANRATTRVVLRNLLVLEAPDEGQRGRRSEGKRRHAT